MIRKCLAAQEGNCYACDSVCVVCGTKKYSVNTDCAICLMCEEERTPANVLEKLKKAEVQQEKPPLLVTETGVKS